jgi:hypothetical protein
MRPLHDTRWVQEFLIKASDIEGFEVFKAVKFQVEVFLLYLHPEDEDSAVLRNAGTLPQYYTASQPRRPQLGSQTLFHKYTHARTHTHETFNGNIFPVSSSNL